MRVVPFVLMAAVACDGGEEIRTRSVLETSQTSYVATAIPDPVFDYEVTVVAKLRNTSDDVVRVSQCTATTNHPPYWVEKTSTGLAAWDPDISCAVFGTPYQDLRPGQERVDTIRMHAPWYRTVTGQPVGDVEGTFFLVYETRICGLVNANGSCYPQDAREYVRSNHFTVVR
jgi:hypothetical protein